MTGDTIATATIEIEAPASEVWTALVSPEAAKQYMFGATLVTDWKEGSAIRWSGEWEGTAYEDKGVVQQVVPKKVLEYTHFSPTTGLPDTPENYHTVTIRLGRAAGGGTLVTLTQDNNPTAEAREQSEKNWIGMLEGLKEYVEEQRG